jgi:hypothetical protein
LARPGSEIRRGWVFATVYSTIRIPRSAMLSRSGLLALPVPMPPITWAVPIATVTARAATGKPRRTATAQASAVATGMMPGWPA